MDDRNKWNIGNHWQERLEKAILNSRPFFKFEGIHHRPENNKLDFLFNTIIEFLDSYGYKAVGYEYPTGLKVKTMVKGKKAVIEVTDKSGEDVYEDDILYTRATTMNEFIYLFDNVLNNDK